MTNCSIKRKLLQGYLYLLKYEIKLNTSMDIAFPELILTLKTPLPSDLLIIETESAVSSRVITSQFVQKTLLFTYSNPLA